MKEFLKRNKYNLLIVFVVGLLIYGIRIVCYTISVDTEIFIGDPNQILNNWMSIGRFGLVGIKELFHLIPINITITNIFTFIIFYFSIIIWMINIEKLQKCTNRYSTLVFGLVLISSPIFVEQFGFTLQSLEIAIAFFVLAMGMFFQDKFLVKNKIWCAVVTIIALSFTFLCYQAFIFLYITICVFDYFIRFNGKMNYKIIAKYLILFGISIVVYYSSVEILTRVLEIEKTSYLFEQIGWGKESFVIVLLKTIYYNVTTTSLFMGILFDVILGILFIFVSKFVLLKYKIKTNKMFYLVYMFMFVSPFISGIIKGNVEVYRAKFALAFLIAFLMYFIVNNYKSIASKKIIKIFVISAIVMQSMVSFYIFFQDYQRYKYDENIGIAINDTVKDMNLEKPVVFIGENKYTDLPKIGESLGISFFEWDSAETYGVNPRVMYFLDNINIKYNTPSLEAIEHAKELSNNMPSWPAKGSVNEFDDFILVKLSDPVEYEE